MSEENWLSRAGASQVYSQPWEKQNVFPKPGRLEQGQLQMSPCPQDGATTSVTALPPPPGLGEEPKVKLNPIIMAIQQQHLPSAQIKLFLVSV